MDVEDNFRAEDLFGDDDGYQEDGENLESINAIKEAIEAPATQKKEENDEEKPKKKIIRKPQPKLDPDRILGHRGIKTLPDVFKDFKPKGGDHVFEDLDRAMKKMEHWAHRLYPKLPFDDTMARISVLGKKMTVSVNVKKIRRGDEPMTKTLSPEEVPEENDEDNTNRYENEEEFPSEDVFEQLMRDADEAEREISAQEKSEPKVSTLTDEQKERMMKNRQLAEQRRLAKQLEKQKLTEATNKPEAAESMDSNDFPNLNIIDDDGDDITIVSKKDKQPMSQEFNSAPKSPAQKSESESLPPNFDMDDFIDNFEMT